MMLVASVLFNVRPDKRFEFLSALPDVIDAIRGFHGCLGCRLMSDCEIENVFLITSEWDGRLYLERYLASTEFEILEGTRFLLRDGPTLSVDEVVSRRRVPLLRRNRSRE